MSAAGYVHVLRLRPQHDHCLAELSGTQKRAEDPETGPEGVSFKAGVCVHCNVYVHKSMYIYIYICIYICIHKSMYTVHI